PLFRRANLADYERKWHSLIGVGAAFLACADHARALSRSKALLPAAIAQTPMNAADAPCGQTCNWQYNSQARGRVPY
ncbi:hypothetical protein SE17_44235, partial [Kouleothrix aurantiaca]